MLSTCEYLQENGRRVIVARKLEKVVLWKTKHAVFQNFSESSVNHDDIAGGLGSFELGKRVVI